MQIQKSVLRLLLTITLALLLSFCCTNVLAQDKNIVVRLAKLQIDSAQLDKYKAALKEEIEASVRLEPGVLTLYAVYEKDNPTRVTVFEIYANEKAYRLHIETPHFKKYKTNTMEMIKSLELTETIPIALESKLSKAK